MTLEALDAGGRKTRNPKAEIREKSETRNPKPGVGGEMCLSA